MIARYLTSIVSITSAAYNCFIVPTSSAGVISEKTPLIVVVPTSHGENVVLEENNSVQQICTPLHALAVKIVLVNSVLL